MLTDETLVAFVTTGNPAAARAFYEGVLGLTILHDDPQHMVFQSGAGRVFFQKAERASPPHGSALGWNVKDLRATMRELSARGVAFERFGLDQDEHGVWSPTPGDGVAWFKDPDGNTIGISGKIKDVGNPHADSDTAA